MLHQSVPDFPFTLGFFWYSTLPDYFSHHHHSGMISAPLNVLLGAPDYTGAIIETTIQFGKSQDAPKKSSIE